jgi:hypothetical protein
MKFSVPCLFVCFGLIFGGALSGDEACKPGKTGKPEAIAGQAAWDLAHERALKWEPDARVFEITTISTGPMDNEGRSTEWYIKFSSEAAKAVDLITISKGNISCWSQSGAGGRVIDFDEKIILDTKHLYDLAQKSGGEKFTASGYKVSAGLNQNPSAGPLWYFNYENDKYQQGLSVVIDAKKGTVTNVFK